MLAVILIASSVCLHLVAVERQVHHGEVMIQRAEPTTCSGQLGCEFALCSSSVASKVVHFHPLFALSSTPFITLPAAPAICICRLRLL